MFQIMLRWWIVSPPSIQDNTEIGEPLAAIEKNSEEEHVWARGETEEQIYVAMLSEIFD